jgi:hypothetical protein
MTIRWLSKMGRRSMSGDAWCAVGLAIDAARSGSSDDVAKETLARDIASTPQTAVAAALARLERSQGHVSYLRDRAKRLLQAAWSGEPVEMMPSENLEVFQREMRLGGMPMGDAYMELSKTEPGLLALQKMVADRSALGSRQGAAGESVSINSKREIRRRAGELVGPRSKQHDPLMRSNMALSIAHRYLYALGGDATFGDSQTPYFSAPNTVRSEPER